MPLQNRVTPFGDIQADASRGRLMGNRGCLHDDAQRLGRARWRHKAWISCKLSFRGRQRQVMAPRRYTELFFTDDCVALAAGHRPCAECRRAEYTAFRAALIAGSDALGPEARAGDLDAVLHAARTGAARRWSAAPTSLPEGTFTVGPDDAALLIWRGKWWRWGFGGYTRHDAPRPFEVPVLTPRPIVQALRAGYSPAVQPEV